MSNPFHICFLRFSSLGDVLLQSSFFSWLKLNHGHNVFLHFFTSDEFSHLFKEHPHLDQVSSFDRKKGESALKVFKKINKDRRVDLILDAHGTMRAQLLKFIFPHIPRLSVDKRTWERQIFRWTKINFLENSVYCMRNLEDLQGIFNQKYSQPELSHFLKQELEVSKYGPGQITSYDGSFKPWDTNLTKEFLELNLDKKWLVIGPSASFEKKRWPLGFFVELVQRVLQENDEYQVILLAGPEDDFCDEFSKSIHHENFTNLQGRTSYEQSAQIIGRATCFIGNDSGLGHIAEAQGTRVITLFGPTHEAFGFAPYLDQSSALSRNDLSCRPCTTKGDGPCSQISRICLEGISVDKVYATFKVSA